MATGPDAKRGSTGDLRGAGGTMSRPPILRTGLADTARVEAFSDGVLAIVICISLDLI
jgi:hypothetical protein